MNIKLGHLSVFTALLFVGGCTSHPSAPPKQAELPIAVKEFDGSKNYNAYPTTLGVWVVELPVTTRIEAIKAITIWVNTTGVEGRRKGDNVYCDQIQLVNDDAAHASIASQLVFRTEVERSHVDISKVTEGYASGGGDVFTLKEGGDINFPLLRANLGQAKVFINLVNGQPQPHLFTVNSVKVLAELR